MTKPTQEKISIRVGDSVEILTEYTGILLSYCHHSGNYEISISLRLTKYRYCRPVFSRMFYSDLREKEICAEPLSGFHRYTRSKSHAAACFYFCDISPFIEPCRVKSIKRNSIKFYLILKKSTYMIIPIFSQAWYLRNSSVELKLFLRRQKADCR
jgi:hypothetical protein